MKPEQLEILPNNLESIYYDTTNRIMSDIVRRIKKYKSITSTADYEINRLVELGQSKKFIEDEIKRLTSLSDKEYKAMIKEVVTSDYVRQESIYKQTNTPYIPFDKNAQLQQTTNAILKQTKGELLNISNTLGFALQEQGKTVFLPLTSYYEKKVDSAIIDIVSGAFTYDDVLKRTVIELSNSGVRTIAYDSGMTSNIITASRRAVMTSVNQLAGKINEYNADKLGTDTYEVTRHIGSRPSHQVWQGKVFTMEKLISVCGLGTVGGLAGANCRHGYYPFIKGISERNYSDKQLRELNNKENVKREYNGQYYNEYEATQQQRKIEAALRLQRSRIDLGKKGESSIDIGGAKIKYRGLLAEYKKFSAKTGLSEQRSRIYVDGLGRM